LVFSIISSTLAKKMLCGRENFFGDTDDLDVGAVLILLQETTNVSVNEPGNADAERRR
jgi:hypothetical protein